ncbi:hypothetical protein LTR97_011597 [Elasticomyces elasticus]|uniref:CRIB domain-containing protein n=1 Tax=Elasticomyces elasticus TaxID=574655 RepID=A0AAN7VYE9_9PEZI|nr:hypothetical protein LTR97_011597 [Elasticomyces elasticus]
MASIADSVPRRDRSTSLFSTNSYSRHQRPQRPAYEAQHHWTTPEGTINEDGALPKRRSLFGRALSDAAASRRMPTLHSTMSSRAHHPPRPDTALSATRRTKTEPLQQIRNSIFGSRKRPTPPSSRDGMSLDEDQPSPQSVQGDALLPRENFRSEQDYYRYLRKNSISPPFNFEHVTHTAKQQLPPLETVDEKDLPARFWSVSAYQRPRRQLTGIRADDLSEKLPAMGVERGAPSSRPTSPAPAELDVDRPRIAGSIGPVSNISETMFDETKDTHYDPPNPTREAVKPRTQQGYPHRKSSLLALNEQRLKYLSMLSPVSPVASNEDNCSVEVEESHSPPDRKALIDAVSERDCAASRHDSAVIDRSRQPLPPVPDHALPNRRSRSSLRLFDQAAASRSSITPSETTCSEMSLSSSQSTFQSPTVSKPARSSNPTLTSLLSDATWEDDVEFSYEHQAESTCNFDWQDTTTLREPSIAESEGGVRLSAWIAPPPALMPERSQSAQDNSRGHLAYDRRASSVGHRGFSAARTNSPQNNKKSATPPNMKFVPRQSSHMSSVLSPVFSIAGSDGEASPQAFSPNTLHFKGFDGVQRVSCDYLSDPESNSTLSSRNRTSASSSSYETAMRHGSAPTVRETGRWSTASSISPPDLVHSKRASMLRPPKSLPQTSGTVSSSMRNPGAQAIRPIASTLNMNRPQSPGERASMQGAPKAAQRRPPTPSRFSRLLAVDEGRQPAAVKGPEWI